MTGTVDQQEKRLPHTDLYMRNHKLEPIMELILAIATILGGFAALWFFVDKFRVIVRQYVLNYKFITRPSTESDRPRWLPNTELKFPLEVVNAVSHLFPDARLPNADDIHGDWSSFGDSNTMFPLITMGRFLNKNTDDYALFLIPKGDAYKYVATVLTKNNENLESIEIERGQIEPQRLFIEKIDPGRYLTAKAKGYDLGDTDMPEVLILKHDAIHFGMFESADFIYYWNNDKKKFDKVCLSD
jgi:hypothetical protein